VLGGVAAEARRPEARRRQAMGNAASTRNTMPPAYEKMGSPEGNPRIALRFGRLPSSCDTDGGWRGEASEGPSRTPPPRLPDIPFDLTLSLAANEVRGGRRIVDGRAHPTFELESRGRAWIPGFDEAVVPREKARHYRRLDDDSEPGLRSAMRIRSASRHSHPRVPLRGSSARAKHSTPRWSGLRA